MKGLIFISKNLNLFLSFLSIFTIIICIFFIPNLEILNNREIKIIDFIENGELLWPSPEYTHINSYFGKRPAPVKGTPSFHYGIDIGAPEGSQFVAVTNGTISFVGFLGGGGYTITLTDENELNGEIKYSYCHCDPDFLVSIGDYILKGQIIGNVGPKYVYGVPGNIYSDSNGNPTNGATTGPHLHFGIRINR